MPTTYNKVVLDNTTLMDISDTTAVASDVASGKYFYAADGTKTLGTATGGTAAISVVDTTDSHGGTVRTITGLDISDTTAVASDVASGKYFYTADGTKTTGTASSGGGSSGQTATGTVTGTGTTTLEIPCSFAPDLIYVYGDLTSSASLRGVVKFTIIKDTSITITNDTSTSNTNEVLYGSTTNITGYGDSNNPHATYSNNVLTLDMVADSASTRFASDVTYTYELSTLGTGGGGGNLPTLQAKTNINPTTSSQTITADSGYDGLSSVQINAMPSGTAGTPTATKSSVSNHSITVTPSVTNTTGYITGSTINGTGVSVTASELASGNKEITSNGNNIDVVGYSTVSVNVSGGGTPSATAHTIYFEFTDSTNTTITAYYDSTFISNAITATEPTTYGGKSVTLAQLDGVTWYQYDPTEQWETLFDGTTQLISDTPYPYFWIASLSSTQIPVGSVWRVTMDGVESGRLTATNSSYGGMIGNPLYSGGSDDGSGLKYDFFNAGWGAWSGGADMVAGNHTVKIERLIT